MNKMRAGRQCDGGFQKKGGRKPVVKPLLLAKAGPTLIVKKEGRARPQLKRVRGVPPKSEKG